MLTRERNSHDLKFILKELQEEELQELAIRNQKSGEFEQNIKMAKYSQ